MRHVDLMPAENDRPFGFPEAPFRIDQDGDIVDKNGWLVSVTPVEVWRDRMAVARMVCRALNALAGQETP